MENIDKVVNKLIVDYIENLKEYNWTREKVYTILYAFKIDNPLKIYTVKGRTKEAKSVKEKLLNRYRDKLLDKERPEKIEDLVKDLVGLKIVCYYKQDLKDLDGFIRTRFVLDPREIPEIYAINESDALNTFDRDKPNRELANEKEDEGYQFYIIERESKDRIFKIKTKDSKYTGTHYTIYFKKKELKGHLRIPVEIQLKTIIQEAYGELEHDISYKYPKVDIQNHFPFISQSLQAADEQIKLIKQKVEDESKEFINFLKKYYPEEVVAKKEEDILLLLRKKELDKANEIIEDLFNSLDEALKNILKHDIKIKALKTVISGMDLYERNVIKIELKAILFKIYLEYIIETEQCDSETNKGIFKSILENNPKKALEVLKDIAILELPKKALFMLDDFLKQVWGKEEAMEDAILLIIAILFEKGEFWNEIESGQRDSWKKIILNYIKNCKSLHSDSVINYLKPSMEKFREISVDYTSFDDFFEEVKREALKRKSPEINHVWQNRSIS